MHILVPSGCICIEQFVGFNRFHALFFTLSTTFSSEEKVGRVHTFMYTISFSHINTLSNIYIYLSMSNQLCYAYANVRLRAARRDDENKTF